MENSYMLCFFPACQIKEKLLMIIPIPADPVEPPWNRYFKPYSSSRNTCLLYVHFGGFLAFRYFHTARSGIYLPVVSTT
jgi:hypothetical protein